MNQKIYKEEDLPWAELEKLGLAEKGKLLISKNDKEALLSGRRTALQTISNLSDGNLHISEIELKLSLVRDEQGKLQLQAHPIHHHPEAPLGLNEQEAAQLISGEKTIILKKLKDIEIPVHGFLFEYDPETREFIKTNSSKIIVPERVNGEQLTPIQMENYRKGNEIALDDGTRFRYTGIDPNPVRADRMLLIASIMIDGGLTYVAYHGLKTLAGFLNRHPKAAEKTEGYLKMEKEMEKHQAQAQDKKVDHEQNRAYTRSGRSR